MKINYLVQFCFSFLFFLFSLLIIVRNLLSPFFILFQLSTLTPKYASNYQYCWHHYDRAQYSYLNPSRNFIEPEVLQQRVKSFEHFDKSFLHGVYKLLIPARRLRDGALLFSVFVFFSHKSFEIFYRSLAFVFVVISI